jgi:uncharacterized protein YoxC
MPPSKRNPDETDSMNSFYKWIIGLATTLSASSIAGLLIFLMTTSAHMSSVNATLKHVQEDISQMRGDLRDATASTNLRVDKLVDEVAQNGQRITRLESQVQRQP